MTQIQIDDYVLTDDFTVEKYSISPPEPKTSFVNVPFANGTLDLSEAAGVLAYDSRVIKITAKKLYKSKTDWWLAYSGLLDKINGKKVQVRISDDPGFYYSGRVTKIEETESGRIKGFEITLSADPFKLEEQEISVPVTVGGSASIVLQNSRMPVAPSVTASAAMTIRFDGKSIPINPGTAEYDGLILIEGSNTVAITGSGTVTFRYRRGRF